MTGRGVSVARGRSDREPAAGDSRHDERTAAILGMALGVAFGICFLTGVYSHFAQHPPKWLALPARPAGLYRVTQGIHVITGVATIPLLLAKLWSVYPKLIQWPPFRSLPHLIERVSLVPLVGGALFQLWSGVANIDLWYPLPFYFPAAHYAVAWITVGALMVHIGAKASVTRRALARTTTDDVVDGTVHRSDRRRFLTMVGAASGVLVAATVGMTVGPLERLAVLAPRRPSSGPQGFPVNKTAGEAGVTEAAVADSFRLEVSGNVAQPLSLSLAQLASLPQRSAELPIACVEGWSASLRWGGISLRRLLDEAGAPNDVGVVVHSLERGGLYGQSEVNATQTNDLDTLLALRVADAPLDLDHGFPVRLIAPNRPGVMQTKWISRVEVL
jgi:DMSO/TMAO reductase YedYZ molybdopterin-dependent catalytic subunit